MKDDEDEVLDTDTPAEHVLGGASSGSNSSSEEWNSGGTLRRLHAARRWLKKLIDRGVNPDEVDKALRLAILLDLCMLADLFIYNGADIDKADQMGHSPLYLAALKGRRDIMKQLCAAGADLNKQDLVGTSPLMSACVRGDWYVVNYLLLKRADVGVLDDRNQSALLLAVRYGYADIVQRLLDDEFQHPNRNQADIEGQTPLHIAVRQSNVMIVKHLLVAKLPQTPADVFCRNQRMSGESPLSIAALNGDLEVLRHLLAAVTLQKEEAATPLFIACQKGFVDVVRVLVESGVDVNQTQDGSSPLFIACQNGHLEVVRYLLHESPRKPDKDLANTDDATLLLMASRKGQQSIVDLLWPQWHAQVLADSAASSSTGTAAKAEKIDHDEAGQPSNEEHAVHEESCAAKVVQVLRKALQKRSHAAATRPVLKAEE